MKFGSIMLGELFDQDGLLGQFDCEAPGDERPEPFLRLENRKPMVSEEETACPSHNFGIIFSSRATG